MTSQTRYCFGFKSQVMFFLFSHQVSFISKQWQMFGKLRKTQDNPHNNSRMLLKSKYNFLFTFSKTELMRRREKKSDACFNLAVLVGPVCVFLPSLWNKTQVLKCPRGKNSVGHRPPQINMLNWQTGPDGGKTRNPKAIIAYMGFLTYSHGECVSLGLGRLLPDVVASFSKARSLFGGYRFESSVVKKRFQYLHCVMIQLLPVYFFLLLILSVNICDLFIMQRIMISTVSIYLTKQSTNENLIT